MGPLDRPGGVCRMLAIFLSAQVSVLKPPPGQTKAPVHIAVTSRATPNPRKSSQKKHLSFWWTFQECAALAWPLSIPFSMGKGSGHGPLSCGCLGSCAAWGRGVWTPAAMRTESGQFLAALGMPLLGTM